MELVGGPIHIERAESGEADNVERLVESGNEHVNVGPVFRILGQRNGSTAQGPQSLEVAEKKNDKCVGLGEKQAEDEESVQRAPVIGGVAKEANNLIDAPVSVAKGTEHGQHHESERNEIGIGAAREGQGHEKAEQAENRLLRPGERDDCQKTEDDRGDNEKEEAKKFGEKIFAGTNILPDCGRGHLSLQRTPRKVVVAAADRLLTQLARLAKSSATPELGA